MDALARMVMTKMGQDVVVGDYYVFIGRTRREIRCLQWDGRGFGFYFKRLEREQSRCTAPWCVRNDGVMRLDPSEMRLLLEGSEWVGRVCLSAVPPVSERTARNSIS